MAVVHFNYLKKQNCHPMKMFMDVHYPKHQKHKAGPYLVEIILLSAKYYKTC